MTETIDEKAAVEWFGVKERSRLVSEQVINASRAALKWRQERDEARASSDKFEAESEQKGADLIACEAVAEECREMGALLQVENKALRARIAELEARNSDLLAEMRRVYAENDAAIKRIAELEAQRGKAGARSSKSTAAKHRRPAMSNPIPIWQSNNPVPASPLTDDEISRLMVFGHWSSHQRYALQARIDCDRATIAELRAKVERENEFFGAACRDLAAACKREEDALSEVCRLDATIALYAIDLATARRERDEQSAEVQRLEAIIMSDECNEHCDDCCVNNVHHEARAILARREGK